MGEIVVGVDGSEHSVDALRWALREANLRRCPLRVVASFSTPLMSTGYEVEAADPADFAAATRTMLDAAVETAVSDLDVEGVELIPEVLDGHAGEQLIGLSESADLLVVGARGRGGFLGLLMGSVTTYVVNHARCPVVVVRNSD